MKHEIYKEKRWVVWNLEEVNGRITKVPYTIRGEKASSTDSSTWTTYENALKASAFFSGIGIVFTPDQKFLGIDIDHVLDDKGNLIEQYKKEVTHLIKEANTYTEISPSGTGLHLYFSITSPLPLTSNRKSPYEAYTSGRFFTFTELPYKKLREIRTITAEEATRLLALIGYPWDKNEPLTESLLSSSIFSDDELLDRMFASKNGEKIKSLYEGNITLYDNDMSRADSALLSHLAFWSQRDPLQMEHLWISSPLGAREKTQKRKDYRDRSIKAAIQACKEVYKSPAQGIDFLCTVAANKEKTKTFTLNTENICRILRDHEKFKDMFRYDTFTNTLDIKDSKTSKWRPFDEADVIAIQTRISIVFPFFQKVKKDMVYDAVLQVSRETAIDSATDFIDSIVWDATPRLDQWLTHTYGTPDDEYHQAVGSNWLKGLVKRLYEPGCKFDYVLVLEGPQGSRKSTSLHVLGTIAAQSRSWHVETTMSTDSKDFFMQFSGKAIIEFSEGETLSRTEVKKMKAIITTQSDKYRPPYTRASQDFPRRCVFAMTTNQEEYLKDETGNRRWLPVKLALDEADTDWLKDNRDQLFAEAKHRVIVLKESVHEFPHEETARQQRARRISDPNEDRIIEWYYGPFMSEYQRTDGITAQQVFQSALSGMGSMKKYEEMAIADVLKNVLNLTRKRRMIENIQQWRWVPEDLVSSDEVLSALEVEAE
jgi:predicted P-loop ATPase